MRIYNVTLAIADDEVPDNGALAIIISAALEAQGLTVKSVGVEEVPEITPDDVRLALDLEFDVDGAPPPAT